MCTYVQKSQACESGAFLDLSQPYISSKGLSVVIRAVDFLCLASQLALVRPCLCLLYNGIISRPLESSIYSGAGDLNAGLHGFVTSASSH